MLNYIIGLRFFLLRAGVGVPIMVPLYTSIGIPAAVLPYIGVGILAARAAKQANAGNKKGLIKFTGI